MKSKFAVSVAILLVLANASDVCAGPLGGLTLTYETEITSMMLEGTFPLPLNTDMAMTGYSLVDTHLMLRESPTRASLGRATATYIGNESGPQSPGDIRTGDLFFLESFFDVFFDITLTDVDPMNSFAPGFTNPQLLPPGPAAHMQLGGGEGFMVREADTSKPNFGLFPVNGDVYIGHVDMKIKLPFSVGGNPLKNDILEFQFTTHHVGEVSNQFLILPNGTVVENFDSSAPFSGAISDADVDPPFGPFTLTGPTTVHSLGPQPAGLLAVPEPSTMAMCGIAILCVGFRTLRSRRSS